MKKLETVLAQLSDLYEFNKKLKSFTVQKEETGQDGEISEPDNNAPAQGADQDVVDEEGGVRSVLSS